MKKPGVGQSCMSFIKQLPKEPPEWPMTEDYARLSGAFTSLNENINQPVKAVSATGLLGIKWLRVLFLGFWQGTSKLVLSIRIDHNHNNLSRALCIRVFVDSNRNVTGASCWCSMTLSDLFSLPGAGQRVFELLDLKPDICEAGSTWVAIVV